jgi:SAM-dependent MidA family methyltransferase
MPDDDAVETSGRTPRAARVALRAGDGRAARFEDWMRVALYDPELGYYGRNVRGLGVRGDFATASTLHPALGEAVAAWAVLRRKELFGGGLSPWHLIEGGPGTGELARTVLEALPFLARRTVTLHLVETSPVLRARQRERLGGRAAWHDSMADALAACEGRALVYASELLDALPVCVLRRWGGGWEELWISSNGAECREEWRPVSSEGAEASGAFSVFSRSWPAGQRVEIAPAVRDWFHSWKSFFLQGSLLILDYGYSVDSLYERRPRGSLRGYAHHQRLEGADLYANAGLVDLTADVNFTDLIAWGEEQGLTTTRFESQADFLRRFVQRVDARAGSEPALAFLLDPRGAGAAFKALELVRAV